MYPNSHASATPQIVMPMNNMVSSVNKFETPHVRISNAMQESVSPFYSSASNVQYTNPTMPMNERIGHATTSIRPVILNRHMPHLMTIIFQHHTQL
jgi:hypothetical protein